MKNLLNVCFALAIISVSSISFAQTTTQVLVQDSYRVLGGDTISAQIGLNTDLSPKNDSVTFVYDPEFHFFMRGQISDPAYDRRAEFDSYGYVVVAAAGDPGGYYREEPSWITHEAFSSSFDAAGSEIDLSYTYGATYVPTVRGFQSFVIYSNLNDLSGSSPVYDDALRYGPNNYLLTGDGPQTYTTVDFDADSALEGQNAIEVHTSHDAGTGSHWKLMLFANGSAAGYQGIDLSSYHALVFYAKASRPVVLNGAFGTGDDSAQRGFAPLQLGTEYQRFEVDITGLDLSDINTFLWLYMHKSQNPFDYSGVSVFLDDIKLLSSAESFSTSEGDFYLGEDVDASGARTNLQVGFSSDESFITPAATGWYLTRAALADYEAKLLLANAELVNIYVRQCSNDLWVPIDQTPYAPLSESVSTGGGLFSYTATNGLSYLTGTKVDETYGCGGTTVTIPTYIGPQTLRTDANVTFAYLVRHFD